jgi:WD40 repeat protein
VLILKGHENAIRCLTYSPDSRFLASSSEDHRIVVGDLDAM